MYWNCNQKGHYSNAYPKTFKKLVLVSVTSSSVIETSKEDNVALQRVPCVYYLIRFRKKEV